MYTTIKYLKKKLSSIIIIYNSNISYLTQIKLFTQDTLVSNQNIGHLTLLLNIPYVILMCDRVLEWREGYYNGDIKTRKTVQAMELEMKADKIGLQRSEQLKELYKFLLAGEADPQTKRPSAALAPEDLSDLEWYYLVCMSFVFNHNQRYHIPYSHLVN